MDRAIFLVLLGLLVISFGLFVVECRTEKEYKTEFRKFSYQYKKKYSNKEESEQRFQIFKNKLDKIDAHNAQKKKFTMGINKFSDLTPLEFKEMYLGFKPKNAVSRPTQAEPRFGSLPDSVDWRDKNAVSEVKDQGQCGSCWSFSTTGTIEGFHAISTGNLVSLSEQNVIDCSWGAPYNNTGCDGGDMRTALQYVINNKGIDTEDSYEYADYNGGDQEPCQYNPANLGAVIKSVVDVIQGNETDLAFAVVQCPVSVAIDASQQSFQDYDGGIYYEPACQSDLDDLDHGVLVVGYGSDGGDDYWIVKNSWGEDWGMEGYILMARNDDNQCGIATYATYPNK